MYRNRDGREEESRPLGTGLENSEDTPEVMRTEGGTMRRCRASHKAL